MKKIFLTIAVLIVNHFVTFTQCDTTNSIFN